MAVSKTAKILKVIKSENGKIGGCFSFFYVLNSQNHQ